MGRRHSPKSYGMLFPSHLSTRGQAVPTGVGDSWDRGSDEGGAPGYQPKVGVRLPSCLGTQDNMQEFGRSAVYTQDCHAGLRHRGVRF